MGRGIPAPGCPPGFGCPRRTPVLLIVRHVNEYMDQEPVDQVCPGPFAPAVIDPNRPEFRIPGRDSARSRGQGLMLGDRDKLGYVQLAESLANSRERLRRKTAVAFLGGVKSKRGKTTKGDPELPFDASGRLAQTSSEAAFRSFRNHRPTPPGERRRYRSLRRGRCRYPRSRPRC